MNNRRILIGQVDLMGYSTIVLSGSAVFVCPGEKRRDILELLIDSLRKKLIINILVFDSVFERKAPQAAK